MRRLLPLSQVLVTELHCAALPPAEVVQLAHGGGGRASFRLLQEVVLPSLGNLPGAGMHDAATFTVPAGARLAFTTDASVVRPLFFPGGDIGRLAVFGAVNDLAAAGARPLSLSLSLILEEGLPLETLRRVLVSIGAASRSADVAVVTGDTKVVDRGKGDGLYASISGIGVVAPETDIGPWRIRPGDAVLVTGDVGRHGVAILSVREGLAFEAPVESDCAPVTGLLEALLAACVDIHCLRDPTRGGLCAVLHELALSAGVGITLDEAAVPVDEAVLAACEILGLDPWTLACEGRLVVIVPEADAERALSALRGRPEGARAARIGHVDEGPAGRVIAITPLRTRRLLDFSSGEQLPRIC